MSDAGCAFVVPIAFALYRVDVDAPRLSVRAGHGAAGGAPTRQAFTAVRAASHGESPTNLRILYSLPTVLVTACWRRVLASPRGEVWCAAHSRAAPEEMHGLAQQLQEAVSAAGRPAPDLDHLLATST